MVEQLDSYNPAERCPKIASEVAATSSSTPGNYQLLEHDQA